MGEEEVSAADFAFSLTLTMAITFQMTLFYLVNFPDDDIRAYAWDVIGNTILIFSGVLLFAACNGLVKYYLKEFYEIFEFHCLILFLQLCWWISVMQLVIAACSGYLTGTHGKFQFLNKLAGGKHKRINPKTLQLETCATEEDVEKERERNNECFASVCGHMSGFAAIHFFGFLQAETSLNVNPEKAFAGSLLALPGLLLLFRIWSSMRKNIFRPSEKCGDIWSDVALDKENDIIGLAASFLAFLSFRFAMVGHLPPVEGTVIVSPEEALPEMVKVTATFFVCLLGSVVMLWVHHVSGWVPEEDEEASSTRFCNIAENFFNMCVSWACLINVKLFIRFMNFFESAEAIPAKILVAFMVSYGGFILIWVLDKVDDWMKSRNIQAEWMDNCITAIGLAIGFAWEQCFDTAIDDLGDRLEQHFGIWEWLNAWIKLGFAVVLCIIVLPAFRIYIQPTIELADDVRKEENEKIRKSFAGKEEKSLLDVVGKETVKGVSAGASVVGTTAESLANPLIPKSAP